jgi:hypothetical protein
MSTLTVTRPAGRRRLKDAQANVRRPANLRPDNYVGRRRPKPRIGGPTPLILGMAAGALWATAGVFAHMLGLLPW